MYLHFYQKKFGNIEIYLYLCTAKLHKSSQFCKSYTVENN